MAAPSPVPFSVDGKTAIVTGAGSGINYCFAKLLLSKNCNVVLADLSLRPEASELLEKYNSTPRALFHKTDVTDWTALNSLFAFSVKEFGTFQIVCPGAGVFEPPFSNFWQPPTGDSSSASKDPVDGHGHYKTMDVNVTHPIRATQLALVEFLRPSDGSAKASPSNPKRIVHLASVASQGAVLMVPLYIASKHAIDGFVRSLGGLEEAIGVRVNAVGPGIVRTPLWLDHKEKLQFFDEDKDQWVTPDEVAEAMLKLIEDPTMVGGTVLEVGREQTRVVPLYGNTGPSGPGFNISGATKGEKEVFDRLEVDGWGKLN